MTHSTTIQGQTLTKTCRRGHTYVPTPSRKKCYECCRLRQRSRDATKWRDNGPEVREKILARNALWAAVRNGTVKRLPCEVCGEAKSEAHHEDYSKRLDVMWLCMVHHKEHHARLKAKKK